MITPDTLIWGDPDNGGTVAEAVARGGKENEPYFAEVRERCDKSGVSFRVAVAQWDLETNTGRSDRWKTNRNPAGLLVEADADADPATFTLEEAAKVHVWALLYLTRRTWTQTYPPPNAKAFEDRWVAKCNDPNLPRPVVTVADLQRRYVDAAGEPQATWAWDERYAEKICERAHAIFGVKESGQTYTTPEPSKGRDTMPDSLVFGLVPHPLFEDRPITKAEGNGQNDLGQRTVKGVTWHRMLGTLQGTDGHFRRPDVGALTDYGVGVAAIEPALDGTIYRWNDPLGRQSGWASGTWSEAHAYGDGFAFVTKYGVNAINRDRASIEISGNQTTPLSEQSRQAIAELTAYWADQAKIPWNVFPIVPGDGFSFVCWHEEFGPDNGQKKCPFAVVKAESSALIERTRAILKRYQTMATEEPKPPQYAEPNLPEWFARSQLQARPSDAKEGDVLWRVVRRNVEALKRTQRYSEPDTAAKKSGPPVEVREKVYVERVGDVPYVTAKGENKTRQWGITEDGHYVLMSQFSPRIVISAR